MAENNNGNKIFIALDKLFIVQVNDKPFMVQVNENDFYLRNLGLSCLRNNVIQNIEKQNVLLN